jgi:hypothetical protein
MPRHHNPESRSDIVARERLRVLLAGTRIFLERVHRSLTREASRLNTSVKEALSTLWRDADKKLQGVIESQSMGNPKWRREALTKARVFGEELDAKAHLFGHILEEKRFLAALRFLASVLASLSKAFPVLSAVKEFIDAVLCCRDWLPGDPEITSLGDLR